jgi:hypothetical protein
MRSLSFHRLSRRRPNAVDYTPSALVIAGWTGRDRAAVQYHIDELAALGVPRPSSTPVYYRASAGRLTQEADLQVLGPHSSGEAEPVLLSMRDGLFVGIGSDHTDRHVETYSVAVSKQMCAKPISRTLWDAEEVAGHWDKLLVRSYIEENGKRVLYQEGSVAQLRHPTDLITGYSGKAGLPIGTVMFMGTFAAKGGVRPFQDSARFEFILEDPVLKRIISHSVRAHQIPVVS